MIQRVIDSPFSNGKAVLQEEMRDYELRGEKYRYLHRNYKCQDTGIEFTSDDMDFDNLERLYSQYRKAHDIPSPTELRELRELYGLSAAKMSEILGLGANQWRRYEDGEMPSESIGKMLRSIQTPMVFLGYVESCRFKMTDEQYTKLCAKIEKSIINEIKAKPKFQWLHEMFGDGLIRRVAM